MDIIVGFNESSSPIKVPCKGCKKRTSECHGICKEYAEYREAVDKANLEARKRAMAADYGAPIRRGRR